MNDVINLNAERVKRKLGRDYHVLCVWPDLSFCEHHEVDAYMREVRVGDDFKIVKVPVETMAALVDKPTMRQFEDALYRYLHMRVYGKYPEEV